MGRVSKVKQAWTETEVAAHLVGQQTREIAKQLANFRSGILGTALFTLAEESHKILKKVNAKSFHAFDTIRSLHEGAKTKAAVVTNLLRVSHHADLAKKFEEKANKAID